ncbi:hypothetical protein K504DRAFT_160378 [Pleomassaria siparia CBS 279.74]|uniref:Uncharacterized protein n=1 Tax=Pleomassaria siparia CBS 279.74 TaxID=1314801 RepID=A0A6G1JUP4_9PLEO|nr:hypothetical protein K504DRAFT_160378 [Pleomassaria siparia CBS 279.74]
MYIQYCTYMGARISSLFAASGSEQCPDRSDAREKGLLFGLIDGHVTLSTMLGNIAVPRVCSGLHVRFFIITVVDSLVYIYVAGEVHVGGWYLAISKSWCIDTDDL